MNGRSGDGAEISNQEYRTDRSVADGSSASHTWDRPVVLLEAVIVHSAELDILISVLYREEDDFKAYVREVVQTAPHVTGTHTMFIAKTTARQRMADDE
jgi:hypothetical protein